MARSSQKTESPTSSPISQPSNPEVSLLGSPANPTPVPPSEEIVITEPTIQMRPAATAPEEKPVVVVEDSQNITIK